LPPLHVIVHAVVPPQTIVQPVAPLQSVVQPPLGQSIVHVLEPVQSTEDPVSTVTSHVLPPPHVTVLFEPVDTVQLLVPSQVVVQFDRHVPWHDDWPSQVVVHPVPHVALQVFLESHPYVTLSWVPAAPPSASAPPSLLPPPNVHVPPVLHVHALPVQLQSPEQVAEITLPLPPPHAAKNGRPASPKSTAQRSCRSKQFISDLQLFSVPGPGLD
jgi:hypothetical protein